MGEAKMAKIPQNGQWHVDDARLDLPFQLPNGPIALGCVAEIPEAHRFIILSHDETIVAPTQFATQCVVNYLIRISQGELPEVVQIYGAGSAGYVKVVGASCSR